MPPRRSARVANAVERATPALAPLQLPLPLALVHRIFLAVPADSRGRAACVARGWRDALADPALWTRLDLSGNSGISFHMLTSKGDALLRGAAARARGELRELEITLRSHVFQLHALFWVLAANAGSLGDGPLARLVYALRGNRHLRRLDISQNGLSEDFMLERLLPALRANTGMRTFWCGTSFAAAKEAEELVNSRGPVA